MATFASAERDARSISAQLEQVVVLATTFREEPTERREALAQRLAEIGDQLAERVLLHTCHRVELIGILGKPLSVAPDGVTLLRGTAAVERVLLVTAGFDSAVVAEEQLLGQVRDAYETALARGTTGPILNELLRRAIRLGRRVRSEATPGVDRSLADRAASWALARLSAEGPLTGSALVVGSGAMGRIMALRLASAGLSVTVASRSLDRAQRIAGELPGGGRAASSPEGLSAAGRQRLVAVALRSGEGLIGTEMLDAARPALVIDLSSPAAVSPAAAHQLGDRLLNLDRLGREQAASPLPPYAERRLRAAVAAERDRFVTWLAARGSRHAIVLLRRQAEEVRRRHLERLAQSGSLTGDQLAAVDAMTGALVAELLHGPTIRARRDGDTAQLVLDLYGLGR